MSRMGIEFGNVCTNNKRYMPCCCWWLSGHSVRLLLRRSEFKASESLQFYCVELLEKNENETKGGRDKTFLRTINAGHLGNLRSKAHSD